VTGHTLVCPYDEALLASLRGQRVVINVDDVTELAAARQAAERSELEVVCLAAHTELPLAAVPFEEGWLDWPIALHAPRLGRFRELVGCLPLLRRLDLRVFLPTDQTDCYRDLRILSSLGLSCAVDFRTQVDWEALTDLMTYALLGLVPRGPISPFVEIADTFAAGQRADCGRVYFDDPATYLHLDRSGRVALTAALAAQGEFLADRPEACANLDADPAYLEHQQAWRRVFLEPEGCAWCPGWRACSGRLVSFRNGGQACRDFAVELMQVAEARPSGEKRRQSVWQP
jgi:hypothetical protein